MAKGVQRMVLNVPKRALSPAGGGKRGREEEERHQSPGPPFSGRFLPPSRVKEFLNDPDSPRAQQLTFAVVALYVDGPTGRRMKSSHPRTLT